MLAIVVRLRVVGAGVDGGCLLVVLLESVCLDFLAEDCVEASAEGWTEVRVVVEVCVEIWLEFD
jgi:hypothetical protein